MYSTLVHKHPPLLLSSSLHAGGGQTKAACFHGSYGNLLANCFCCCFLGDLSCKGVKFHSLLLFYQTSALFSCGWTCHLRFTFYNLLTWLVLACFVGLPSLAVAQLQEHMKVQEPRSPVDSSRYFGTAKFQNIHWGPIRKKEKKERNSNNKVYFLHCATDNLKKHKATGL